MRFSSNFFRLRVKWWLKIFSFKIEVRILKKLED